MAARRWLKNLRPPLLNPRPSIISLISKQHSSPFKSIPRFSGSRAKPLKYGLIPMLGLTTLFLDSNSESLKEIEPSNTKVEEFLVPNGYIKSEDEVLPNLSYRILYFLRDYVIEPISTTGRFIHLAILFLPVILLSPLLLFELIDGSSTDRRRGKPKRVEERVTTKWWFRFLVAQMARAGPTFIKVSSLSLQS